MSGLAEFASYVMERRGRVAQLEARLLELQKNYESFFQELDRAREGELAQLGELISTQRASLAPELDQALRAAQTEVERGFDEKAAELLARIEALEATAEQTRQTSVEAERKVRADNVELDRQEEELKERSSRLLGEIERYNAQIRQLAGGFGFFVNFFQMRELHKRRARIDREQTTVAAHIERLRAQWAKVEGKHAARETALRDKWVEQSAEAASLRTKLEYLQSSRERIVTRSTLEKVLSPLTARRALGGPSDPACPRCRSRNPAENHFCAYCAQRLREDRPDLLGSWEEISEINHHHALFSEGMKACQEMIGLLRGLGSGLDNFARSVQSMQDTERRYPVKKLQIGVPAASVAWGQNFDELDKALSMQGALHPVSFTEGARKIVAQTFTEQSIQSYFETMGKELSRQAGAQWG